MNDEGRQNMQLWEEAMRYIKAGNADAAEAVADRMKVPSDARLVRDKAKAIRQRGNSDEH